MNSRLFHNQAGLTLAEMLITLAVFTTCFAMALGAFIACSKMYFFSSMLNYAHDEVRGASDIVLNEVRQASIYPVVYSNGVIAPIVNIIQTNNANQPVTNSGYAGNEVRILTKGFFSTVKAGYTANASTMELEDTLVRPPIALFNYVNGTLSNNFTTANTNSQPFVSGSERTNLFNTWLTNTALYGAVRIDTNTLSGSYITNLARNPGSNITLYLSPGLTIPVTADTLVYVGQECRFIVTNNELRHYPNAGDSTKFKTVIKNLSLQGSNASSQPFIYINGNLQVNIRYDSRGDISGRGIYRIVTQATPRANPGLITRTNTVPLNVTNGLPTGGVND